MGSRIPQGIEEKAEFTPRLFVAEAQCLEDHGLNLLAVDPYAAASDLGTVQDEVIGARMDLSGIGFNEGNILKARRCEGVVSGTNRFSVSL